MTGKVTEFDAHTGLGAVESDDGARLLFHCTQVVDRSRTLKVGAKVRYEVMPGGLGVWEAGALEPLGR